MIFYSVSCFNHFYYFYIKILIVTIFFYCNIISFIEWKNDIDFDLMSTKKALGIHSI